MKTQYVTIIGIALICILATACGKAPISSTAASLGACQNLVSTGTWLTTTPPGGGIGQTDTMVLSNTCTGTTTYCNEKFTYQIQADNVSVFIGVSQTSGGPDCFPMGTTICNVSFTANNTLLHLACPSWTIQYQRQ